MMDMADGTFHSMRDCAQTVLMQLPVHQSYELSIYNANLQGLLFRTKCNILSCVTCSGVEQTDWICIGSKGFKSLISLINRVDNVGTHYSLEFANFETYSSKKSLFLTNVKRVESLKKNVLKIIHVIKDEVATMKLEFERKRDVEYFEGVLMTHLGQSSCLPEVVNSSDEGTVMRFFNRLKTSAWSYFGKYFGSTSSLTKNFIHWDSSDWDPWLHTIHIQTDSNVPICRMDTFLNSHSMKSRLLSFLDKQKLDGLRVLGTKPGHYRTTHSELSEFFRTHKGVRHTFLREIKRIVRNNGHFHATYYRVLKKLIAATHRAVRSNKEGGPKPVADLSTITKALDTTCKYYWDRRTCEFRLKMLLLFNIDLMQESETQKLHKLFIEFLCHVAEKWNLSELSNNTPLPPGREFHGLKIRGCTCDLFMASMQVWNEFYGFDLRDISVTTKSLSRQFRNEKHIQTEKEKIKVLTPSHVHRAVRSAQQERSFVQAELRKKKSELRILRNKKMRLGQELNKELISVLDFNEQDKILRVKIGYVKIQKAELAKKLVEVSKKGKNRVKDERIIEAEQKIDSFRKRANTIPMEVSKENEEMMVTWHSRRKIVERMIEKRLAKMDKKGQKGMTKRPRPKRKRKKRMKPSKKKKSLDFLHISVRREEEEEEEEEEFPFHTTASSSEDDLPPVSPPNARMRASQPQFELTCKLMLSKLKNSSPSRVLSRSLRVLDPVLSPSAFTYGYVHASVVLKNVIFGWAEDGVLCLSPLGENDGYDDVCVVDCHCGLYNICGSAFCGLVGAVASRVMDWNRDCSYSPYGDIQSLMSINRKKKGKGKGQKRRKSSGLRFGKRKTDKLVSEEKDQEIEIGEGKRSRNCQQMTLELLKAMGCCSHYQVVDEYFVRVKKKLGRPDAMKDPAVLDNLRVLPCSEKFFETFKEELLAETKWDKERKELVFNSHVQLDTFFWSLKKKDSTFMYSYPGVYHLLKAFDRSFWVNRAKEKTQGTEPLMYPPGCPFDKRIRHSPLKGGKMK